MFRHLMTHETWLSKILKFDFLENKQSFQSEITLLELKNKLAKM